MPELRRRVRHNQDLQADGLYIHSSPPRVLQINSAYIKQLVRNGDIEKLMNLVIEGQGQRLVGGYSADYKTRTFLKTVPTIMSKINLMHDAVNSDRLEELQTLLDEEPEKRKLVLAKDDAGVGLLHKAVYYNLIDIAKYLITNFPNTVNIKDADGRTPYHYTPLCKEPVEIQKLLISAGADPTVLDNKQRSIKYYMNHSSELELPSKHKTTSSPRKSLANREVTSTNLSVKNKRFDQRTPERPPSSISLSKGAAIKKSNIRIWIHHRDLAHLQQVVWEGHGSKLLVEHSNNAKVKRFLEVVPHIMGLIRDIHTDVLNDDLESLKTHSSDPVPPIVLSGKDTNGLATLHKAAGLGREGIVEYIVEAYPNSLFQIDNEGRTPLHYAALTKDDGKIFDFLISSGADESALDNKQKTAAYYKTRTSEIDQKLLQVIPECPRGAKENFAATWDWNLLSASPSTDSIAKTIKKIINEADESVKSEQTEPESEPVESEEKEEEEKKEEENNEEIEQNEEAKGEEETQEEATEETKEEEADETNGQTEKTEEENETEAVADDNNQAEVVEAQEEENNNEENNEAVDEEDAKRDYVNEELMKQLENDTPEEAKEEVITDVMEPLENADEGVIEGIVNGENEVESVNEQGQKLESGDKLDDAEIAALIEEGNMEQLAVLVLSGEGERLVGYSSENAELQAFLENVPTYMSKINRIHLAARDGSLRDLQAALDRRKFAIAKDHVSPNEASPLHVATVFGNTSIVRYLAGRFPETVQTTDNSGRTPLHYAAVLADNGHYFNLLVHLGADVRAQDKFGHTPDYYRSHQDDFSHVILLREFGAEEAAQEILNDKDKSGNNVQVDMPFFYTEEGRYLASSLGDPLIKGLTEVANKRPEDPIAYLATYLYNFANNNTTKEKVQENRQIITGPPQDVDNNNAVPTTIDVVTLDPMEETETEETSAFNATSRDEHGQSMLHFAAARSHGRNALFQLLQETNINIGFRDELYRSARDISIQANIPENTNELDKYVLFIACKGDTDKLVELLLNGYDHITDVIDEDDVPIIEAVSSKNQQDTVAFLQSILTFEEKRERVHHAIRQGLVNDVSSLLADENDSGSGKLLAFGKNSYGRCALHIAVLCQQEEIVDFLVNTFPETLHIGDNLERTALHYAMGIDKMESISKLLIKAGARRITKDLKGRQPTYYFMNKSDILRLQEEEETF